MGNFTDRIKGMFTKGKRPQSGSDFTPEQEELIKKHGGKKNLRKLDQLPIMYAIRSADNPDYFIHPIGETKDQMLYVLKKGIVGAAFWQWSQGIEFIKAGTENLEMIRADKKFLDEQNTKCNG